MAEATFKQAIATFIRQTRPQTFRQGKPPRYPQRSIATAVATPTQVYADHGQPERHGQQSATIQSNASVPRKTRLEKLQAEPDARPFSSFLTDNYSREHNYLRISLTERCNLRCLYCMPEEGIQLSPADHILTTPEIVYLSSLFVDQGVDKIRLTGGEPTVRKDILELMQQIGELRAKGLKELCLTTNGISLHRKLDSMVESGLTGVNLSLDTLDPFQFTIMTRRNGHEAVMKSISRILEMNRLGAGIKLKINCVVMRGLNDSEIVPFVEMGKDKDLEVRFIEYMPFDGNKWSQKKMLGFKEMLALIREKYPDVHKVQDHMNDTSKTYKVPGFAGRIGFITSMTHNFCGTCNRLRITSDGNLKVCLFGNNEVSLRDILRESNDGKPIDAETMQAITELERDHKQALYDSNSISGISERESKLLDVIGVAVKRKKAKHADDVPHAQQSHISSAYQARPSLQTPSPLPFISSSTVFPRLVPTYLLPHSAPSSVLHQHRYRSTFLLRRTYSAKKGLVRYVFNTRTHRRIAHDPLRTTNTREVLEENERVRRAVVMAAWQAIKRRRSDTPQSRTSSSNSKPVTSASLSHLTSSGTAHMVNIGHKRTSHRSATAVSYLIFSSPITYQALNEARLQKGDAVAVARVAGIQAAKKTADLIPLAHPSLCLTSVTIDIDPFAARRSNSVSSSTSRDDEKEGEHALSSEHGGVRVRATVQCHDKTGVEMEALTAANVTALTMYDMLKGIDKAMVISGSRVVEKQGGRSGSWRWNERKKKLEQFEPDTIGTATGHTGVETNTNINNDTNVDTDVKARVTTSVTRNPTTHTTDRSTEAETESKWWPPASGAANSLTTAATPFDIENTISDDNDNTNIIIGTTTTKGPESESEPESETDDANTIFNAEWQSFSDSFSDSPNLPLHSSSSSSTTMTSSQTTSPSSSSSTMSTLPLPTTFRPVTRTDLSGPPTMKCDAASFRRAREDRYSEWLHRGSK